MKSKLLKNYFSLIELLVVIAIISVLTSMLLPALQTSKSKARYTRWQGFNSGSHRNEPSLLAHYDFEEGNGAQLDNGAYGLDIENYEPESLDGNLLNSPVWTEGRWDSKSALYFDGINDYVDCGDNAILDIDEAITMWAWVYNEGADGHIINRGGGWGESGYSLFALGGNIRIELQNSTIPEKMIVDNTGPSLNEWHHVAVTWDTDTDTITTYIDGTAAPVTDVFVGPMGKPPQRLNIARNELHGFYFRGIIDEVAIYDRALSADEIKNYYAMGQP